MYEQLCSAVARFQTKKNILECLHKYDTQQNESLNMSVSRYVPKFKHFGTTMALDTRVRCVIGVRNLGYANFYNTLLFNLGCLAVSDGERLISQGISIIDKTKLNLQKIKKLWSTNVPESMEKKPKTGKQSSRSALIALKTSVHIKLVSEWQRSKSRNRLHEDRIRRSARNVEELATRHGGRKHAFFITNISQAKIRQIKILT